MNLWATRSDLGRAHAFQESGTTSQVTNLWNGGSVAPHQIVDLLNEILAALWRKGSEAPARVPWLCA